MRIPDPALVVLVGAAGSGKSTWAAGHYRPAEVVSSDALRALLGSGPADLDASDDAFRILDQVVTGRTQRGLTVVVDTLGLDAERRAGWAALARRAGLPVVAVVIDTPAAACRARNAARDRPVPASVLGSQAQRMRDVRGEARGRGLGGARRERRGVGSGVGADVISDVVDGLTDRPVVVDGSGEGGEA